MLDSASDYLTGLGFICTMDSHKGKLFALHYEDPHTLEYRQLGASINMEATAFEIYTSNDREEYWIYKGTDLNVFKRTCASLAAAIKASYSS